MTKQTQARASAIPAATPWGAVFSLALGVASLITSDLLPVSLLTPIAKTLDITSGVAGQAVAMSALAAIFSSLFITTFTRGIDRRYVVLGFSLLLITANLLVASAQSYGQLVAGRIVLGLGEGAFWSMSASLAMRLARPEDVPKALSIIFGGVSASLVVAAPLGSLLEPLIGWRGVFGAAAAIGLTTVVWQALVLPKMPAPRDHHRVTAVFQVLRRPLVPVAMLCILLSFMAQRSMLTYIRPLLEIYAGFQVSGISSVLLVFGIANFVGISASSHFLRADIKRCLAGPPLVAAAAFAAILISHGQHGITFVAVAMWGFAIGLVPVAWSTWVIRNVSDDTENAGGLQVAVIQFANMLGASVGGLVLDAHGVTGPTWQGIGLMLATCLLVSLIIPSTRTPEQAATTSG